MARLANEDADLKTLLVKWRELLWDDLIAAFGGATEEAILRIASEGAEALYQKVVRAFVSVAPVAINDAVELLRQRRIPCACIAIDIWTFALMLLGIRIALGKAPAYLPIGGLPRRASDSLVFSTIPGGTARA